MKASRAFRRKALILASGAALLAALSPARAADGVDGVTAVVSRVSSDYVRTKLPGGSFQPKYYAFGKGGHWGGEISDATIDQLRFEDVARVVAAPLSEQNYLPATDPSRTKLIIMLYWGTTAVPGPSSDSIAYNELSAAQANISGSDASMAELSSALTIMAMYNEMRDRLDFQNACMLGYDAEGMIGTDFGNNIRGTAFGAKRQELIEEIEENRYFVVLMAYDFQLMWKQKKHKLLWETRFSINERRNQFDRALPVMAEYASRYFGQPSKGLLRIRVPEGRVDVGKPTLVEYLFGPGKAAAPTTENPSK